MFFNRKREKKKPIFVMMVGLPASGKSIIAEKLAVELPATIESSDKIRIEMFGKDYIYNSSDSSKVFGKLHYNIISKLSNGENVIYDATNIKMKTRMKMIDTLHKSGIDCKKVCYYIAKPIEQCLKDNENSDRQYEKVEDILSMYSNLEIPYYYEGWDNIRIVWTGGRGENSTAWLFNNPDDGLYNYKITVTDTNVIRGEYSYNLGVTLKEVYNGMCFLKYSEVLCNAALFAEIAYPKTQKYTLLNNITNWNRMSAQDSMFYTCVEYSGMLRFMSDTEKIQRKCLDTAVRIQWKDFRKQKDPSSIIKLEKIFGKDLLDDLNILSSRFTLVKQREEYDYRTYHTR